MTGPRQVATSADDQQNKSTTDINDALTAFSESQVANAAHQTFFSLPKAQLLVHATELHTEHLNRQNESTLSEEEQQVLVNALGASRALVEFNYDSLYGDDAETAKDTFTQAVAAVETASKQLRRSPWGKVIAGTMLALLSAALIVASAAIIGLTLGAFTPLVLPALAAFVASLPSLWATLTGVAVGITGMTVGGFSGALFGSAARTNPIRPSLDGIIAAAHQAEAAARPTTAAAPATAQL